MTTARQLTVFSIRQGKNGSIWVRAGTAIINDDDSVSVELDVLPISGTLHLRETPPRAIEMPPKLH